MNNLVVICKIDTLKLSCLKSLETNAPGKICCHCVSLGSPRFSRLSWFSWGPAFALSVSDFSLQQVEASAPRSTSEVSSAPSHVMVTSVTFGMPSCNILQLSGFLALFIASHNLCRCKAHAAKSKHSGKNCECVRSCA